MKQIKWLASLRMVENKEYKSFSGTFYKIKYCHIGKSLE